MLSTAWSRQLGLGIPIVNAPMGGVAGGRLAAAVTAAGGLGTIGMGSSGTVGALHSELALLGDVRPFGVGVVDWVVRRDPALLDAALAARPALLSVSFGHDLSWVRRAHDAGILAAVQVADSEEARRAEIAGVDVIVARGAEGGATATRRSPRCRCSTPSWTRWRCRCSRPGGSRLRAALRPCSPPARAARGWGRA